MAFYEDPIVDGSSERSEESIRFLSELINQKSGFICRHETPDFGVDIEVELILPTGHASANKFPIQVKSAAKVKTVIKDGVSYVSLKFSTSRLGYLHRRMPMCGMIAFYDDANKTMYYDFTEEIIHRINDFNQNKSWREQDTVTIHFLLDKKLEFNSIPSIHERITTQHDNIRYAYDNIDGIQSGKNAVSIEQLPETLDEIDYFLLLPLLINKGDFINAQIALTQIDVRTITNDQDLCLFAAIIYCEVGNVIEAQYYIKKCKRFSYEDDNPLYELFLIIEPKVSLLLGTIDLKDYCKKLEQSLQYITNTTNSVSVRLNIYQYKCIKVLETKKFSTSLESEIIEFINEISSLNISRERVLSLVVSHIQSISLYADTYMSAIVREQKMRERLGNEKPEEIKIKEIKRYLNLSDIVSNSLEGAYKFALETNNNLLKAEALMVNAKTYLHKATSLWLLDLAPEVSLLIQEKSEGHIQGLKRAFGIFMEETRFKEAQLCLGMIIDFDNAYLAIYGFSLNTSQLDAVRSNLKAIQNEYGMAEFEETDYNKLRNLSTQSLTLVELVEKHGDLYFSTMADQILAASDYPNDRKENLILDLKNHFEFEKSGLGNRYELLLREVNDGPVDYIKPVTYIVKDTLSGLEFGPSHSVEELLDVIPREQNFK